MKNVIGNSRGATTQNKSKTANSQTRQKPARFFVPDVKNRRFKDKNQIITLTLLKYVFVFLGGFEFGLTSLLIFMLTIARFSLIFMGN
jgi:hypothetical protein